MTNEQLVLLIQGGNDDKLIDLYRQNKGLIQKVVRKYAGYEDVEDLQQEAFFGLCNAAKLFKHDSGTAFSTYVVYWIKQSCLRYIENSGGVIRVPAHQRQRIAKYKSTLNNFRMQFARDPSPAELMAVLSIDRDQLEQLKKDALALSVRSMEETITVDGSADPVTLGDTIADPVDHIEAATDQIQNEQLAAVLWSLVEELQTEEKAAIKARYIDGLQYEQIAEKIGLKDAGSAKAATNKALNVLRRKESREQLKPYYECSGYIYGLGLSANGLYHFRRTFTSGTELAALQLINPNHNSLPFNAQN